MARRNRSCPRRLLLLLLALIVPGGAPSLTESLEANADQETTYEDSLEEMCLAEHGESRVAAPWRFAVAAASRLSSLTGTRRPIVGHRLSHDLLAPLVC